MIFDIHKNHAQNIAWYGLFVIEYDFSSACSIFVRCFYVSMAKQPSHGDVTQELQHSHRICGNGPPQSDIKVTKPVDAALAVVVLVLFPARKAQIDAGIVPEMALFSMRNSLSVVNCPALMAGTVPVRALLNK
jgi:hypothetical protein